MKSAAIRRLYLDYFVARGHREVPSSPLVPADDPSLLFTNSGMVQFKRVFLGQERRDYSRATSCQKCVRAGGKHNDLEQVGHTRRHHTFFEMLGNFSFGDYFKRDAIGYAWEFLTGTDYLAIPAARLSVSVHHTDDEARALWREIAGLPDERIYGLGDKDNFWQMADTGPCGYNSEIYVDLEWRSGQEPAALPVTEFERLAEEGRFLEIWNLVFMQFDRGTDGSLTPLPKPSVDTGAGLERIAAVLQGEDDNFHTDIFLPLLERVGELVGRPYERAGAESASFRVLADHARAVSFLLIDGVYPGNEGRGYVLRRILRRGVRHAWLLGRREPTLAALTEVVVREMGDAYPELREKADFIRDVTLKEEEQFFTTVEDGMRRLDEIFAGGTGTVSGDDAFKLYDTFGFPIDLTQVIASERGYAVDFPAFERALDEQRQRSRDARGAATRGPAVHAGGTGEWRSLKPGGQRFVGYDATQAESDLLAFRESEGRVELLLAENPFYAESGGQVSDTGSVSGAGWRLPVDSVRKTERGTIVGGPSTSPFEPTPVRAEVDSERRRSIERNHSATHLVHAALRRHLGTHVRQQGSLVDPARLRFDFSHHGPIEPELLRDIEADVNEQILANPAVITREMSYPDALELGAMALFSEKYGDVVRVVQMGSSIELCGGTHVRTTGQIGTFRFAGQAGVAAGVRRIEAITGAAALAAVREIELRLSRIAEVLKAQPEHVQRRLEQLLEERQRLEARLRQALSEAAPPGPDEPTQRIGDIDLALRDTASDDRQELNQLADAFRNGRQSAALILFGTAGRGAIHVALTDDLVKRGLKAGDLANRIAALSGGRGGGRPAFASASIGDPGQLDATRTAAPSIVAGWLAAAS